MSVEKAVSGGGGVGIIMAAKHGAMAVWSSTQRKYVSKSLLKVLTFL